MKRVLVLLAMAVVLAGMASSAQAALISITFDEAGITVGDTIADQYAEQGVTWTGSNTVTLGADFSNAFDPIDPATPQILQYDSKPTDGVIHLSTPADYFSIDYRRPSSPGDITLALYNGDALVHDYGIIGWTGPDWENFTYNGEYGNIDGIVLYSSNKFVMDNLEVNTVPIPASFWLLATGLIPIIRASGRRGRK